MILDLAEWLLDHWEEVTLNTLLLFILRKFIVNEIKVLLRFSRNDAILSNQKVIMRELGVENEWSSHEHGLNFTALTNSKKWLPIFTMEIQKQKSILRRTKFMEKLKSRKLWLAIFGALFPVLNVELGINLDPNMVFGVLTVLISAIVGLAHVDGKKAQAVVKALKASIPVDPNATYIDMIPTIQKVHDGINGLLAIAKTNDVNVLAAYAPLLELIKSFEHPEPLPIIPEQQVAS